MKNNVYANYQLAKEIYAEIGVDTDSAIEALKKIPISLHCWQGDDVLGFLFRDTALSGGIQTTGNYPGRAATVDQLRGDLDVAFSLIPGKTRLNLHSIYADTEEKVDLCDLAPRHFASWIDYAKERKIGLDYNPSCFSHPMAESGFTISSADPAVRDFWIAHCAGSRRIGEAMGKALDDKCIINHWFPDGYKDIPVDREAPRRRMMEALDEMRKEKLDERYFLDSLESKVFGIGAESYTVASNEFALGYAISRGISYTLDSGHFHPTEVISDKISSVLLYTKEMLLHVSRPVRWDSDHVVILDDELNAIAASLIRTGLVERTHIGLDYFDASINRVAAWVIGTRNMQKALLRALLEPTAAWKKLENEGDYTARLALTEEHKTLPMGAVWDYYCETMGVPVRDAWLCEVRKYEKEVLVNR
ncbi:MAG: L-rhamnose isomerase [Clostridia bacterium]|nr:L-rhamnose isomerase [Clostridia bacterium]MBO7171325.1 L-rhamnose isomerase [Clostridia bacterium]